MANVPYIVVQVLIPGFTPRIGVRLYANKDDAQQ